MWNEQLPNEGLAMLGNDTTDAMISDENHLRTVRSEIMSEHIDSASESISEIEALAYFYDLKQSDKIKDITTDITSSLEILRAIIESYADGDEENDDIAVFIDQMNALTRERYDVGYKPHRNWRRDQD